MYGQGDCIKTRKPLTCDHLHCIRMHTITYINTTKNIQLIFVNENKSMRMMGETSIIVI